MLARNSSVKATASQQITRKAASARSGGEITLGLTTTPVDDRSNTFNIDVQIKNGSNERVAINLIKFRKADAIKVSDVSDSTSTSVRAQHATLVANTAKLVQDQITRLLPGFARSYAEALIKEINELTKSPSRVLRWYRDLAQSLWKNNTEKMRIEGEHVRVNIRNAADVKQALALLPLSSNDDVVTKLIQYNVKLLEDFEAEINKKDLSLVPQIYPGGELNRTYVVTCPRRWFDVASYSVDFEVQYALLGDEANVRSVTKGASIAVSANPVTLSIVAVVASFLGSMIKLTPLDKSGIATLPKEFSSYPGTFIVGAVVALIFFNVYEYTSYRDKVRPTVSWRTALFLGVISALLADRLIAALITFVKGAATT
jgi:hypothetical protein